MTVARSDDPYRGTPAKTALAVELRLERADFTLDVAFGCPPGVTCVMGPSGSGKSTILALLAGLAEPQRGRIVLGDQVWLDVAKAVRVPTEQRRLAYVFQSLALFPHMNAIHNVEYGMPRDVPRPDRHARAQALLDKLGVGHLAKRRPRTFSGGEAQRVALARAMARAPQVVLLDEPFSALDRELRTQLIGVVRDLVAELGVPIVHVTHSVAEARQLADQVVRLDKGKVVQQGAPADVLEGLTTLEE